ncbi:MULTISPECIES: glycine cleavage system protein H [Streptomyces]|uniref:hypothetical protein n=1 Tax=Streptomyces TaxID=1883 RepID=UPI0029BBC6F0|nr:hypothetical protein [Streptomyces sp. WI03-4A]MDX2596639.1 hypothetical protein [Streptomyces sp. WI03-4A]
MSDILADLRYTDASDEPEEVIGDPYGTWLFKIKPAAGAATDQFMDAAAYADLIG